MNRRVLLSSACLAASVLGMWLSGTLSDMHARGSAGTGLLAGACGGEGDGCTTVIASRWSVFPPGPAADDTTALESAGSSGVPVALLGVWYFIVLAVWFAAIHQPGHDRRRWHRRLLGFCTLGCLASVWFIIVMAFLVRAWCPLCLSTHVVNFLLLGLVFLARPPADGAEDSAPRGRTPTNPHPTPRLLGVSAVLAGVMCFAYWQRATVLGFDAREREFAEIAAELETFKQDTGTLKAMFETQPEVELDVRDDDPTVLNQKTPYMRVTYFSDMECPQCAKFDKMLFEEIAPLFNGHLRIVYKHFPLVDKHPNAMRAAQATQAAHLQGKFWEAHKYLLERRARLGAVDYDVMAKQLGLDAARLKSDMDSPAVASAIREDLQLASRLRLSAAPAAFLNKRQVSRVLRNTLGFWKERAEALRTTTLKGGKEW